jgi:hypothetical protein
MTPQITVNLSYEEIRAVIKSLSIGCEQVTRKLERVESTKWEPEVKLELELLMSANGAFQQALLNALREMPI